MKSYWIYNLIIALSTGLVFFINEFSFYGTLLNIRINIALCVLLCLQFLFSLFYLVLGIIKGMKYSQGDILLAIIVMGIISISDLFIFNGGVWDSDTANFRECLFYRLVKVSVPGLPGCLLLFCQL